MSNTRCRWVVGCWSEVHFTSKWKRKLNPGSQSIWLQSESCFGTWAEIDVEHLQMAKARSAKLSIKFRRRGVRIFYYTSRKANLAGLSVERVEWICLYGNNCKFNNLILEISKRLRRQPEPRKKGSCSALINSWMNNPSRMIYAALTPIRKSMEGREMLFELFPISAFVFSSSSPVFVQTSPLFRRKKEGKIP